MATKVFISQPMNGRSKEEILAERKKIEQAVRLKFDDYEILDSFFDDFHEADKAKNAALCFLGRSIQLMSFADVVVFAEGWEHARGCSVEYMAAKAYEIDILYWNRFTLI